MRHQLVVTACTVFLAIGSSAIAKTRPVRPAPAPLASPYVLPPNGILTKDDLVRYTLRILTFKPKDQFDAPPDTTAVRGREFSVELTANYSYDTANSALTFDIYPQEWSSISLLSANV